MSTPQETLNAALVPAVVVESDGKDEQAVNLAVIAREAMAKLEKDLADVKAWNDEIAQKKQEWADRRVAVKKKQEDEEVVEVQRKVDKDAKKKGWVQPFLLEGWNADSFLV